MIAIQREVIERRQGYPAARLALDQVRAGLLASAGVSQTTKIQEEHPMNPRSKENTP